MFRRLMLSALALSAFLALEGCNSTRLVAPVVSEEKQVPLGKNEPVRRPRVPASQFAVGEREGDGTDNGTNGAGADTGAAGSDSLFWAGDPVM